MLVNNSIRQLLLQVVKQNNIQLNLFIVNLQYVFS